MRPLLLFTSLMLLGCTSSNNLSSGGNDGSTDLSNLQSMDLTVTPDLGGPGAACTTACDCMPGLSCGMAMTCEQNTRGNIYCCENPTCPDGNFCQSMDGTFMMCGGGRDGGFMMRGDGGMRNRDGGMRNRDMSQ